MSRMLAIDPGLKTGWAFKNGIQFVSGCWNLAGNRFEGAGMRYIRFLKYLDEIGQVDLVFYEEVRRHLGTDAAHLYGAVISHLQTWCERHKIPYQGVPIGTWKRFVTGKGNSNKFRVFEAIRKRYNLDPKTFHEADAIGILKWAEEEYAKEEKSQEKVRFGASG